MDNEVCSHICLFLRGIVALGTMSIANAASFGLQRKGLMRFSPKNAVMADHKHVASDARSDESHQRPAGKKIYAVNPSAGV
jgi:hypothetical protein